MHQNTGSAAGAQQGGHQIHNLRMQDRRNFVMFAGGSRARQNKDPGADNGANTERGQRPWAQALVQPPPWVFGLGDQLVNGFAAKQLAAARLGGGFSSPARG